jgi:hypothetical protein
MRGDVWQGADARQSHFEYNARESEIETGCDGEEADEGDATGTIQKDSVLFL